MTITSILNIIGILMLMYAGCLGLFSSFTEKNQDIVHRTGATFGNEEFYRTMISQKYFNISSFFFIIIGSFFLLLPYIIPEQFINVRTSSGTLILGISILSLVLILFGIIKYATYKSDQITVKNQIVILSDRKQKIELTDFNLNVIIRILKQRKVKTDFTDIEQIKQSAIKVFRIK
ncbi:hypothetical protein D9V96_016920 [Zobellia laminariae]|uniref:hypothetical protein n=1 Tax=Zobellia laminariae TaxID=248906 RepID=UPI004056CBC7